MIIDWQCRSCLAEGKFEDLENNNCPYCESEEIEDFRGKPVYINVYLVDRCYGGPEEGGWYYDAGQPIASIPTDTLEEQSRIYWLMREKYSNEGRRGLDSVLSDGIYRVIEERHFAEPYPKQRPHYE